MPFLSGADFHVGESSGEILHCKLNPKNHRSVIKIIAWISVEYINYMHRIVFSLL